MTTLPTTPLEPWVCRKIGAPLNRPLDRRELARFQLAALNQTLAHVRRYSPFYRDRLAALPDRLSALDDLTAVPVTTATDLARDPMALLCVSRDRVARVVTLETSGTTGRPKRLFFTASDLELTIDFFHHGMSCLTSPGQRVLILLPGDSPDSVGDLLARALIRLPATGRVYGPVRDPADAVEAARKNRADVLVGIPVQVLAMADSDRGRELAGRIQTVLLTTDYVPDAVVARLRRRWGCRVFKHYGMTEMGLGGGVECGALNGYHLREADLLVEIVDPVDGRPVADGTPGEIVVTTLTRRGMPLIRYRTGDRAAFGVDPCPCATVLKTLGAIGGRVDGALPLTGGPPVFLGDLDEAVFAVDGVANYRAGTQGEGNVRRLCLWVAVTAGAAFDDAAARILAGINRLPAIRSAAAAGRLAIDIQPASKPIPVSTGTGKRRIEKERT